MVKAEIYRDGKHRGSVKGSLLLCMTATANDDGSMDGDCVIAGRGDQADAMWALDKLINVAAKQFDMSISEMLGLIWLKNLGDDEEQADD